MKLQPWFDDVATSQVTTTSSTASTVLLILHDSTSSLLSISDSQVCGCHESLCKRPERSLERVADGMGSWSSGSFLLY